MRARGRLTLARAIGLSLALTLASFGGPATATPARSAARLSALVPPSAGVPPWRPAPEPT